MLDTHRVSLMSLDAMAEGSSDPAIVEQLRRANRSRQLTLLRAVLDRARTLALGPVPSMDEAWALLAGAQERDEAAADRVIEHPLTGLWAAKALRRLGEANTTGGEPPIWADLGYLHQLATAAAIRAGLDFRSRVPVWRGRVMLPTLGLADVQSSREWDFAQVTGENGQVLIRGPAGSVQLPENRSADAVGWLPLHTLRMDGGELWLDDLDPYREFDGPIPPRRLPASEVNLWTDILRAAWRLLTEHHPATAAELGAGLTTVVPRATTDPYTPFSASHSDAFGCVGMSRPADPTTCAATLVHEFQHSKFGVLLTLVDLLDPAEDNDTPRLYAPWRDDPRPPSGLLHGVFSFLGVTAFYRWHRDRSGRPARATHFEFAYRLEQTVRAVKTLLTDAVPSALGHRFLSTARNQLQAWAAEPVPDDVRVAAHRANADHHLSWRLRHLQPSSARVADLAIAWRQNRRKPTVAPGAPLLNPLSGAPTHPRLTLIRTWLTEPDLYEIYRAEPELAMAQIAGVTEADFALIDGDSDTAAELYRQQIIARPDSLNAWAGLALANGLKVLLSQLELVFAVHQEVQARFGVVACPVRLARWLDQI